MTAVRSGQTDATTMGTHRAIVRAGHLVEVRDRATATPGPGELSIAPVIAGLCGTDIQMLRGLRDDPAPVVGHEGLAVVVSAGPGVPAALAPGTRVVINPTHPTDPSFLLGHNVDGLLQERVLLPASAVSGGMVVPLPHGPHDELAALVEPLAVVRYAFEVLVRARPDPAALVVIGDGTVGRLAVRAAARWLRPGVRTVLVHHTEAGRAWSADHEPAAHTRLVAGEPLWVDGPVAAVLATPRTGTVDALDTALRACPEVAVDLLGGLPAGARSTLLPGVPLAEIRAANCGGVPATPVITTVPGPRGPVRLCGHRGAANRHLLAAAEELSTAGARYRSLITHITDLDGAAGLMADLAQGRRNARDGRRVIKLAVRFTPPEEK